MTYRSAFMLAFAVGAVAGCGSKPTIKAATTSPDSAHTAGGEVGANAASKDARDMSTPAAALTRFEHGDTANMNLAPGRKGADLAQYRAAIRAGFKRMDTWPKGPERLAGSLLPQNRIVAYYGNPHSKKMGVLGEYPEQTMLSKLDATLADWRK